MRRPATRWSAVIISAVAVAALLQFPATADLPGCKNCIDKTDIGKNAVGTSEVIDQSLTKEDVGPGAVGSSELVNASVKPRDLHPRSKVALGVEELFGSTTNNTSPAELASFTVTVPAKGTLVVTVTGSLYFQTFTSPSLTHQIGQIALCRTSASFAECGGTHQLIRFGDVDLTDGDNASLGFTLVREFQVSKGTKTFYVNGFSDNLSTGMSIGDDSAEPQDEGQTFAIVEYAPKSLTITSTKGEDGP